MFSCNWQEIALYICQHRHTMKPSDLSTMEKRLEGALDMQAVQNMNNGMQSIGNSAAVGSFIKAYRTELPPSTLKILEKKSQGMSKLGLQQIKN